MARLVARDPSGKLAQKRRFQAPGLEGLKDLPPFHKSRPQTTPSEVVENVLALSLEHPTRGCVRLSDLPKLQGISLSSPTVQNILIEHEMGSRYERLLKLEERTASEPIELSAEQIHPDRTTRMGLPVPNGRGGRRSA
jgi:hypothetical protein